MIKPLNFFHSLPLQFTAALLSLNSVSTATAEVRLPGFFNDHMVFQQQTPIRVWGWADAGESVVVSLGDQSVNAQPSADASGKWIAELPAMTASHTPLKMTVGVQGASPDALIKIEDILIGEVWLCSGQSNMEWTVSRSVNAETEIAAANHPLIRHIKIPRVPSPTPLNDVKADWQVCSPETAGSFTAAGYFMARKLAEQLDIPVGLINSSWGGTRVEPWTPPIGFQAVDSLADIHQSVVQRTPGSDIYHARLQQHVNATQLWLSLAKMKLAKDEYVDPSPAFPTEISPFTSHQDPTMLYNGMIHALVGYPIRGAIWYQGESNHSEGLLYFEKKKALINGWRELWGQDAFPFYYVQIAPFQYGNEDPAVLPVFWEAQAKCLEIENTGMVVINDIATLADIHPPNKQDVGKRLALLALKNDYGKDDVVASGPTFESLELGGDHLRVVFTNTGGGLKTRDGEAPKHFEIIDSNSNGFQPAKATIEGDVVILRSEKVNEPVAMRFAWHKLAEPNLTGGTGLPTGAFRAGELPEFFETVPGNADYQLVYELDLAKLGPSFQYDLDHSDQVGHFDRIGYLLSLGSSDTDVQQVFVTMNAFTDDVSKIGIPTLSSGARFQQKVESMDVFTTLKGLTTGTAIQTGNIEFWPHNYGPGNDAKIGNADSTVYDFGDSYAPPEDGYGSMQIHNFGARQTVFAINHWKMGKSADLGIGNSTGKSRDWTFTGTAAAYAKKQLRVYVRPTK